MADVEELVTGPAAASRSGGSEPLAVAPDRGAGHGRSQAWGQHPVDIRLSIPLPFVRCYLTIVAGRERRAPERRVAERRKHPLIRFGNVVVFACVGTMLGLAGLAAVQFATLAFLQQSRLLGD